MEAANRPHPLRALTSAGGPLFAVLATLALAAPLASGAPPAAPDPTTFAGLVGDTFALFNFSTNETVFAGADWGEAASLDEPPHFEHHFEEPAAGTAHSVKLTGLQPAHDYHVRVTVRSLANETNATAPFILTSFDSRPDPSVPLWADALVTAGVLGGVFATGRRRDLGRLPAVAGVLCAGGIFTVTLVSGFVVPGFSFGRNAISDLGDPPEGWLFNWGLVIFAPLGAVMVVWGLRPALEGGLLREAGVATGALLAVLAGLIGVYSERTHELHGLVSHVLFAVASISAGLLAVPIFADRRLRWASGVPLVAAGALFVVTLVTFSGLSEGLAVFLLIAWNGVTGGLLYARPAAAGERAPA